MCARIYPDLLGKTELLRNASSQVPLSQCGDGRCLFLTTDLDPGEGSYFQAIERATNAQVNYLTLQVSAKQVAQG